MLPKFENRYQGVRKRSLRGDIYLGIDKTTNEDVAIKIEELHARRGSHELEQEAHVYRRLSNDLGVNNCRWYGTVGTKSVLVLDLLGQSLEGLFKLCGNKFSLKTILMLAGKYEKKNNNVHKNKPRFIAY